MGTEDSLLSYECSECHSILKVDAGKTPRECCKGAKLLLLNPEPPQKYLGILKDSELFDKITKQEFDKKIVGEVAGRRVIFLCGAGGRLVKNCQVASYNVLVNDEAGVGKDYVTGKALQIIPKEYYLHKTRISPTVFTYWHNSQYEPEWSWDGKVFYAEDISEMVLNSDVFKVMCSGGSSATIVVKQRAVDLHIEGKPVMITTTATATPNPELVRRFVILNLDSSEEQTKAIMKRHCEYAKIGIIPEYNEDYTTAMKFLKRVDVQIPFADKLSEVLPSKSIIMRTHLPRFLDYIKASAAFHQYQRNEENGFLVAEGKDYDLAKECFLKLCSNKYMIPLTINQKHILKIFEENPTRRYSASQFHAENNFLSLPALQTNLGLLSKYGILQSGVDKDSYGRDLEVYSLSKSYNPNDKLDLPNFDELCRIALVSKPSLVSKTTLVSKPLHVKKGDGKDIKDVKAELRINNFSDQELQEAGLTREDLE